MEYPCVYHNLAVITVVLRVYCGIITSQKSTGSRPVRTLVLIPWAFPMIIVTFTWSYLLNDLYGIVNAKLLHWNLIAQPIQFLANPKIAMLTVSLINVWFGVPLFAINILASLQTISRDLYEAAQIDGASPFQRFRFITLPFVRVVVGLLIIFADNLDL